MWSGQFDMGARFSRFAAVAVLVGAFWTVPSVSSRGEGALGNSFVHVDAVLLVDLAASQLSLQRADQVVIRAVAGL
jgi:hypothetical protein